VKGKGTENGMKEMKRREGRGENTPLGFGFASICAKVAWHIFTDESARSRPVAKGGGLGLNPPEKPPQKILGLPLAVLASNSVLCRMQLYCPYTLV